ncbi:hypothetical protein Gotur_004012 [Gossypium turneri]
MESGGHISLGSTVGEDNDSEVATDEYVGDFATSGGVDNDSGEEEDGNETEVWDLDEHGSLLGLIKMKNMKMLRERIASFS